MYYRNNKNQEVYKVIDVQVLNANNNVNFEDQHMLLYKNKRGNKFVRKREEFYLKFTKSTKKEYLNQ